MEITKEELEIILKEKDLVVVDFWAGWCGPCRLMKPVFEQFGENNPDVAIHTVSADTNEGVGQVYGLKSIPAFIYFKNGVEVGRLMGRQSIEDLQANLDAHV